MTHENLSDDWVRKIFRKMIEEACYDFGKSDYPSDPEWYLNRITVNDMRRILSELILNPYMTVRESVFRHLNC